MDVFAIALLVGQSLSLFGVFVILFGVIISTIFFVRDYFSGKHLPDHVVYKTYRTNLARAVLLGLEVLVAGDLIKSVVGNPDFKTVGLLVLIVLIRSFLSVTFDMEIEGRWPWKRK